MSTRTAATIGWLIAATTLLSACAQGIPSTPEGLARPAEVSVSAHAALAQPDRMEVLALEPTLQRFESNADPSTFHGYRILGRADVTEIATRLELVYWIYRGVADSDGTVAACFNPRHGVRATLDSGATVDLVICYECLSMHIHEGEARSSATTTSGVGREVERIFATLGLDMPR